MPTVNPVVLRRRYVVITALTWLPQGLGMTTMVLLMTDRGIDLVTIGVLFVLQSAVVTGLELPTGGFSDVLGRRGVLVVSAAVGIAGFAWLAIAHQPWEFVGVALLRGVARALSTGPAEAWYVDAVDGGDIRNGLAYGQTATGLALGIGTLGGGAIAVAVPAVGWWPLDPLATPMMLAALLYVALLVVAARGMVEPYRANTADTSLVVMVRDVPRTIIDGVKLGFGRGALARLLMTSGLLGIGLNAVEMLTPGWLETLTSDPGRAAAVYGVVTALGFGASALGSVVNPLTARLLRGNVPATAIVGSLVAGFGLMLIFLTAYLADTAAVAMVAVGYSVMFFGIGLRNPSQSELVHYEVTSAQRATVVSIQSLLLQGGGALSALVIPWLVIIWSVPVVMLLSGIALGASALLFVGHGFPAASKPEKAVA